MVTLIFVCGNKFFKKDNSTNTKVSEKSMELVHREDFLDYLETNNLVSAFDGIDLEDYIKEYSITKEYLNNYHPENLLDDYKSRKEQQKYAAIMAKKVISVDSTDEEYVSFIDNFFKVINIEYEPIGMSQALDRYDIATEDNRYSLYIGKTKNLDQYNIRNDGVDGTSQIYIPSGDMEMRAQLCLSRDNKFFLVVVTNGNNDDFSYELSKLFTEI